MAQDRRHRGFLQFLRKVVDVPLGYSKDDLINFRSLAAKDYPSILQLIDDYILFAERSDTDVIPTLLLKDPKKPKPRPDPSHMHLFDMLREKELFKSNYDLADFAGRVLPGMSRHRFDKMSRGDIAARIIEYLETRDRRTREELEASMRAAITSGVDKPAERKSFLSQWEKIIKGIEF